MTGVEILIERLAAHAPQVGRCFQGGHPPAQASCENGI
jgi:hypothetical protein